MSPSPSDTVSSTASPSDTVSTTVSPTVSPSPAAYVFGGLYTTQTDASKCLAADTNVFKNMFGGVNDFACPSGYTGSVVGHTRSSEPGYNDCLVDLYLCILTGTTVDPRGYFGGMYQTTDWPGSTSSFPGPVPATVYETSNPLGSNPSGCDIGYTDTVICT